MAEILSGIKASLILRINDVPEIREIFKASKIKPVELKYSVAREKATKGKELLISNY